MYANWEPGKIFGSIIKYLSSNTSCFIVCEAKCFGPYMIIIRPSYESSQEMLATLTCFANRPDDGHVKILVFGPDRKELARDWRKQRNEELNDLYCLSNIVWMINLMSVRWAGMLNE